MRKTKTIVAFCLAVIMAISLSAVPASAKSTDVSALSKDLRTYVKLDAYVFTHIKEDVEIVQGVQEGNTEALDKYLTDPEERALFLRVMNLPMTAGDLIKTALITANPSNIERNRVLFLKVNPSDPGMFESNTQGKALSTVGILTSGRSSQKKIDLYPSLFYINSSKELIVIATLTNNTENTVQLAGIPHIELLSDGKVFASGNAENFESPMILSPHVNQVQTGIQDGIPDKCFLRITFAPGTYDSNVDISNLDNINSVYAMDYQVLK